MTRSACTASRNPFASRHIDALPFRACGVSVPDLCVRLEGLGGRAAIVGPHGSGKTTLMEQMADELGASGWRIHRFRTRANGGGYSETWLDREYAKNDAVLVDGAGHIGPFGRQRLLHAARKAGRVLVTAHRPVRLPTLHRCEPSLTLLDGLVFELAAHRASDLRAVSHALYAAHNGNIRDVLRGLYDHWAGLTQYR